MKACYLAACLAAAIPIAAAPLPAIAAAPGESVSGTVSYDGKATEIGEVHARQVDDLYFTPPDPSSVKIMLADRELSAAARASQFAFTDEVAAQKLRAIMIKVAIATGELQTLAVSHPQGGGSTVSGLFDQYALSDFKIADGWVSGRIRTLKPQEFAFPPEVENPELSYAFDVRFRARIQPPPKPQQVLIGVAAQQSPQANAAVALMTLLNTGNIARIRAGLHPGSRFASRFADDTSARETLTQLKEAGIIVPPARYLASIKRVVNFGEHAAVVSSDGSGSSITQVSLTDGVWREGGGLPLIGD